jgi:hypothetical protein
MSRQSRVFSLGWVLAALATLAIIGGVTFVGCTHPTRTTHPEGGDDGGTSDCDVDVPWAPVQGCFEPISPGYDPADVAAASAAGRPPRLLPGWTSACFPDLQGRGHCGPSSLTDMPDKATDNKAQKLAKAIQALNKCIKIENECRSMANTGTPEEQMDQDREACCVCKLRLHNPQTGDPVMPGQGGVLDCCTEAANVLEASCELGNCMAVDCFLRGEADPNYNHMACSMTANNMLYTPSAKNPPGDDGDEVSAHTCPFFNGAPGPDGGVVSGDEGDPLNFAMPGTCPGGTNPWFATICYGLPQCSAIPPGLPPCNTGSQAVMDNAQNFHKAWQTNQSDACKFHSGDTITEAESFCIFGTSTPPPGDNGHFSKKLRR